MRLLLLCALLVPFAAQAETTHRLSVLTQSGLGLYLSRHQTAGGVGGGFGLRDTVDERVLLQADLSYLVMLGNAGRLRLGAGLQRRGTWTPFALVTGTTFFGDRLTFLTPARPAASGVPPLALGVTVAPLRFRAQRTTVSLLEVGVGVGWDFPGAGTQVGLTFIEVAVDL